ncbi:MULTISPECIES: alpha/beta fold hydrolase [Ralstonia]|uniref:Alpha/beta fold hydrolase n=2 Tax=Pseudomonadota TaxID=1224 RepID=A0AAE3I7F5_9RALS|nr:alpha/beta fold hydrolase [Ralstonia mojiangensis]MCO5414686.1 alpha/beta fold hydrolase [Ralstonia mojiangensis]MCT7297782.1 alpha/beta fold hydrolase [Ralstonia mojiangensis]MCT7312120.1 alpha/beta fold hydrolase [Ralstonia mojiangensis]MCT7318597.1 alpha/beta fold hydrolase [Ralstonia mojiangensis]MCT7327429.1 alpha/beta fold hydrolase [Ralstonia mojiangensis]
MRVDTFNGMYPYTPRFTDAPGFSMHFVDEGPADGAVVLCLHGEPTWGFLFRRLIAALHGAHRVVVPDHMGFGRSETPPSRSYWLQDHIDNLERFVLALDLRGITLVMHDFGGPVGMGLASRHPDRIRRIVSVNGPTPFGQATLGERLAANAAVSPWFQWIVRAESEGRLEAVLGELGFNILSTLKLNGFEDHRLINDAWLQAYGARFATPADCAGAIGWAKGVATGAHRFEIPDGAAHRAIATKPAMAIWGMSDRTLHAEHFLPLFSELFPDAPVHRLPSIGHYSLEDAPDAIAHRIATFLAQT